MFRAARLVDPNLRIVRAGQLYASSGDEVSHDAKSLLLGLDNAKEVACGREPTVAPESSFLFQHIDTKIVHLRAPWSCRTPGVPDASTVATTPRLATCNPPRSCRRPESCRTKERPMMGRRPRHTLGMLVNIYGSLSTEDK